MRKFSELKSFMNNNLKNNNLELDFFNAHFQIYRNNTDMNMSIGNSEGPVIKFEERQPNIFTIAVTYDKQCIIKYGKAKEFSLSDNITTLIEAFPDGYLIDDVVAALLKIK